MRCTGYKYRQAIFYYRYSAHNENTTILDILSQNYTKEKGKV